MDGAGSGISVPQLGEQLAFATDRFQVTPWLPPGPDTVAVILIGAEPTATNANVLLRLTTRGVPPPLDWEPPPHETTIRLVKIETTMDAGRFMATFTIE